MCILMKAKSMIRVLLYQIDLVQINERKLAINPTSVLIFVTTFFVRDMYGVIRT